jgi:hypothetical protein
MTLKGNTLLKEEWPLLAMLFQVSLAVSWADNLSATTWKTSPRSLFHSFSLLPLHCHSCAHDIGCVLLE